ncbi:MAG: DUF5828 family protein [Halodesulfurarchaeum sp.]|nr:DUF5828 family protein [Halodesulfurarchaeum sp.]
MEESISGFKQRGTWGEVVEHGERITNALREAGARESHTDAFEEWVEWRPKMHEQIESDVSEKTADQASVGKGEGEAKGKTADEDLQSAGERLTESYEHIEDNDANGAVEKWQDTIDYVARAADTASRKALRKLENTVYQKVMTQVAPYYFDNDLISANIQRVRAQDEFVFEVNVNDEELKEEVKEHLRSFEDVDRWHVDTEKDIEVAKAVEGVEAPSGADKPDDAKPDSQTN